MKPPIIADTLLDPQDPPDDFVDPPEPPQCPSTCYDRAASMDTRCRQPEGHGGRHDDGAMTWEDGPGQCPCVASDGTRCELDAGHAPKAQHKSGDVHWYSFGPFPKPSAVDLSALVEPEPAGCIHSKIVKDWHNVEGDVMGKCADCGESGFPMREAEQYDHTTDTCTTDPLAARVVAVLGDKTTGDYRTELEAALDELEAQREIARLRLTNAQRKAIHHCAHMAKFGWSAATNRACPRRWMQKLALMGLVEPAGMSRLVDGDGFAVQPERWSESWRLTDAGRKIAPYV